MLPSSCCTLSLLVGAVLCFAWCAAAPARAQEVLLLDGMETPARWEAHGITLSVSPDCVEGTGALKLAGSGHLRLKPEALHGVDLGRFDRLVMHVKVLDGQVTDIGAAVCGFPQTSLAFPRWAEYDESTPAGVWLELSLDLRLPEWNGGDASLFGADSPALSLLYTPGKRNTGILVDAVRLVKDPVRIAYDWAPPVKPLRLVTRGNAVQYEKAIDLENVSGAPLDVVVRFSGASLQQFSGRVVPGALTLQPGETRRVTAHIDVPAGLAPLAYELQEIQVIPANDQRLMQRLALLTAAPFAPVAKPFTVKRVPAGRVAAGLLDRYPTDRLPAHPCVWMSQSALNSKGSCANGHAGQSPDGFDRLKCNTCGAVMEGTPTTGGIFHRALIDYAGELALAYHRTKEEAYARKARELFLTYAREYHKYPLNPPISQASSHLAPNNATYVLGTVVMTPMTRALDLIWDAGVLSEEDKRLIGEGFIWPAALEMMKIHPGLTNMQDAMNDALFNAGVLLGDPNLTAVALFGSHGLQAKIASVFDDDGATPESISSGYHAAALRPVLRQVESVKNAGLPVEIQFDRLEKAKVLMDLLRMPDGRVPNRGDAATPMAGRPDADLAAYGSMSFKHYGLTILREGEGPDALYVALDHRPPSQTHSHRDKLSIIFYGMGQDFGCDEGSLYNMDSSKQNKDANWGRRGAWGSSTLVHNTITVDGSDQQFCGADLLYFKGDRGGYQAVAARTDTAYQGVTLERNILLLGGVMVTVDRGISDTPRTYDWTHHSHGALTAPAALQPVATLGEGVYALPEAPTWGTVAGNADFRWTREQASCRLTLVGDAAPVVYGTAMGWANQAYQRARIEAPFVLARRQGKAATFVAVFEPFTGETPAVTRITRVPVTANGKKVGDDQAIALKVEKAGETLYFLVNFTPGEKTAGPLRTAERCFALRVTR